MNETNALNVFNTCEPAELTGSIGRSRIDSPLRTEDMVTDMKFDTAVCSEEQAKIIISLRPFESVQDLRTRLQKKRGVSVGLFEQYMEVMQGYIQVDRCLNKCENIGNRPETPPRPAHLPVKPASSHATAAGRHLPDAPRGAESPML
jgi:hypothetical protein